MKRHPAGITHTRGQLTLSLLLGLTACPAVDEAVDRSAAISAPAQQGPKDQATDPEAPRAEEVQPPLAAESAPPASARLDGVPPRERLLSAATSYFERTPGRRIYVQVDKPLYRPGESIWIKTWDLRARDLASPTDPGAVQYQLVNPKGAVVIEKRVEERRGTATNDFEIPEGFQGGEYIVRAIATDGQFGERPVTVSAYEAPRLKKKLEFVRKAYGPGDVVSATVQVQRATGEALGRHPVKGVIWMDGETLSPVSATTNAEGGVIIKFTLPARIERGDGLLTVMIEDGGVTESVSKRIPILLKKLDFSFFPEGGQLVVGIPGRVYFEAKDMIGKPADVEGRLVDDHGNAVATFATHHFGLGRIDFTPGTGRTYHAEILRPTGITETYPVPLAAPEGCVLRSFDDLDGQISELRVAVRCSQPRKVIVAAIQRNNVLDVAAVEVPEAGPAIVYLASKEPRLQNMQGATRVTVLDESLNPLAERLIYRNRRRGLHVDIAPDKTEYSPRDQVALTVSTTDDQGTGIPAELAISVVDDTVVSFADDKTGHMLSRLFLEPEIADKVEEPNFFFDLTKPKSALAMDLLMGTRGYRRFEWRAVLRPPVPASAPVLEVAEMAAEGIDMDRAMARGGMGRARMEPMPAPVAQNEPGRRLVPAPQQPAKVARQNIAFPMEGKADRKREAAGAGAPRAAEPPRDAPPARAKMKRREDLAVLRAPGVQAADAEGQEEAKRRPLAEPIWAPVRVFPAPSYRGDETGPRNDFRETIHFAPNVTTGKDGKTTLTFYLSDAVTSFRVFAEGIGAGLAGRSEKVIKSSLPFSMSVKLPLEVSAGDRFLLPVSLSNDRNRGVAVSLESSFGDLLSLGEGIEGAVEGNAIFTTQRTTQTTLEGGEKKTVFYPVTVKADSNGKSTVRVFANASGLTDELTRELVVMPIGFPVLDKASGKLKGRVSQRFDLTGAIAGSVTASLKLYPSTMSTLLGGLDGMLREPGGCFEQTSSTNYPNVMVMQYMKANDIADPELVERASGLLDRGYKRLVGFETKDKGYEWFGQTPGHEALTAYGLLEFTDFKAVYGGVDEEMIRRTQAWIKSRRNGRGGFERDAKALDSFGGAKPEITNAYIIYSLTEAGVTDLEREIAAQAALASSTSDPYLLALATSTILNIPSRKSEGVRAAAKLASMQRANGGWVGEDHSITRSTGINLEIETTALALLALMKAGSHDDAVRRGVEWLYNNRGAYGAWSATQATVLALKALTRFSIDSRKIQGSGQVEVIVNGKQAGRVSYASGQRDAITLEGLGNAFEPGTNQIELVQIGDGELPFSLAIEHRAVKPVTNANVVVDLTTKLERTEIRMGENVRLTATIRNKTQAGQPMTIARVGLPGGLTFQLWQLKELKEKGLVAFTETRAREVIIYFRDLKPGETKEVPLDLVAQIPGEFVGPASTAYLYYSDDAKTWTDGLKVSIGR